MPLLNLGCGNRCHPSWTNVDLLKRSKTIIPIDLRKGIPFADGTYDVVYHSHLLEHFQKTQVLPFLKECFRVLRHEGVIRVVVPDLERIVKVYLQALNMAVCGDEEWQHNYEWIILEMYDQTVREHSGGEMSEYLRRNNIPNLDFVSERIGIEVYQMVEKARQKREQNSYEKPKRSLLNRLFHLILNLHPTFTLVRERLIQLILGKEYDVLKLGRFRQGGEIHYWMYDRYSLAKLLIKAGFQNPLVMRPNKSHIPAWKDYHLDIEADGSVYKPDSLYMEAFKL